MFLRLLTLSDTLRHRARRLRWSHDQAVGRHGEDLAHRFLQRSGFTIAARNYRLESGAGEIDLIGWDRETLVFVEVKTRETDQFGAPDRAIGQEKLRTMVRAARNYTHRADVLWQNVRFDIVNVVMGTQPSLTHIRDVVPIRPAL
jgi:putative endonuclease